MSPRYAREWQRAWGWQHRTLNDEPIFWSDSVDELFEKMNDAHQGQGPVRMREPDEFERLVDTKTGTVVAGWYGDRLMFDDRWMGDLPF